MKHILISLFIFLFIHFTLISQNKILNSLTLDECIKIGLSNNKSLNSSNNRIMNAEARYSEAKSSQFPQFKFLGSYTRLSDIPPFEITMPPPISKTFSISPVILDNYNFKLSIQQPIFTGFKIQSSKDMAEFNSLSTVEDYNKDKSDLIFNIKKTFFNLLKLQKVLNLISENIKQVESHLRDIKNFYEKGISDKNDVLKTEVQLSNIKVTYLETENLVRISKLNLCNLLGIPLTQDIEIQDIRLDSAFSINKLEHYLNVAFTNRADLKSTDYKVKIAESNVRFAGSNWFPQVFLSANYTYANPNQRIMPAVKEFKDTWDIGISLSFDIWNWGLNSAKVDQASSQLNEVQNVLSQLKDGVILDVNQSYLNVLQSREKILYTQKALEQGEENYRIALEKFSKGLLSNSEMLDAEVILLQVKVNNTNAIIDYHIALAKLEKSVGK